MTCKLVTLKLQATRTVLKQLDLENLTEGQLNQLEEILPKTIMEELAPVVHLKEGYFRVSGMSEEVVRSDGGQLTDHTREEARNMAYGHGGGCGFGFCHELDQPQVRA